MKKISVTKSGLNSKPLDSGATLAQIGTNDDTQLAIPRAVIEYFSVDPTPENADVPQYIYLTEWVNKLKGRVSGRRVYTLNEAEAALNLGVQLYGLLRSAMAFRQFCLEIPDRIDAAPKTTGTAGVNYMLIDSSDTDAISKIDGIIGRLQACVKAVGIPMGWKRVLDYLFGYYWDSSHGTKILHVSLMHATMYRVVTTDGFAWGTNSVNTQPGESSVRSMSELINALISDISDQHVGQVVSDALDVKLFTEVPDQVQAEIKEWALHKLVAANCPNFGTLIPSTGANGQPIYSWDNLDPAHVDTGEQDQELTVFVWNNSNLVEQDVFLAAVGVIDDSLQDTVQTGAISRNYLVVVNYSNAGNEQYNAMPAPFWLSNTILDPQAINRSAFVGSYISGEPDLFPVEYFTYQQDGTAEANENMWRQRVAANYGVARFMMRNIRQDYAINAVVDLMWEGSNRSWDKHSNGHRDGKQSDQQREKDRK